MIDSKKYNLHSDFAQKKSELRNRFYVANATQLEWDFDDDDDKNDLADRTIWSIHQHWHESRAPKGGGTRLTKPTRKGESVN